VLECGHSVRRGDGKSVNTVCGGAAVRVWIQCEAAAVVRVCAQRGGGGGVKSVTVCGDGGVIV
jgi:hypothetical protein